MKANIFVLLFILVLSFQSAWALTITYPAEGDTFYAGSQLTIIVKPDGSEQFETVLFGIYPMTYYSIKKEYIYSLTIPKNLTGIIDDLIVIASDVSGNVTELRRSIVVKLPPNVILQSIVVNPNPLFLEKLPPESAPDDIRVFGNRDLKVHGVYSDGVKRKLGSSASGTNYTSSNDKVVTVYPEGKAVAQGIGNATITVRNGTSHVDVRVIVDPYKE